MRWWFLVLVLAFMAAACGGSSSPTSSTAPGPGTSTTVESSDTTIASEGITTTTGAATSTTSVTGPEPTSPPTTAIGVDGAGDACDPYWDFVAAADEREAADALRRLSISLALPSPDDLLAAVDVLRGRSAELTEPAARELLDSYLADFCGAPDPSFAGSFDVLSAQGVLVAGPNGVQLLDGSVVVPADPVGTFLASFGDSTGGTASLLEIRGLEIIEYQEGTAAIPRDLLLGEDISLHDVADINGRPVAVVTSWTTDDFGEPVQQLELVPVDGGDISRIAQVGGIEFGATTISYAAGLFLITSSSDGGGVLQVLDIGGTQLEAPWLPEPESGPGQFVEPFQFARFAPDGDTYAYLRVSPGVGAGGADVLRTDAVVRRVSDGGEVLRIQIGGLDERFTSLAYDGHWVVVSGRDGLIVVDTWAPGDSEVAGISIADVESVSLLDSGLNYGP